MKKPLILLAVAAALVACSNNQTERPSVSGQRKNMQSLTRRPAFDATAESVASSGFNTNTNVQAFIRYEAVKGHFKEADLRDFPSNAVYKGNIINIIYQPSTSCPWYKFRTGNSGESKFNDGRQFYVANRDIVDDVSCRYGVSPKLTVAITGIETNYGKNTGSLRIADTLSMLAFDHPRRTEFFQDELSELLSMAKEEKTDMFSFKGSYAGAMGMPQFMPSSFRKRTVDYDGGGHRDIWNNIGDMVAPVASHMKAHGWQTRGKMIVPITLDPAPQIRAIIDEQTTLTRTVADFRELGMVLTEGVTDDEKTVLYRLEISPGVYEYYLGLNNFHVVWKYNHSRTYVIAVRDIANTVGLAGL